MRIADVNIEERSLIYPGSKGGDERQLISRPSLRLTFFDDTGRVGAGEASPFPGYSRESFDDVRMAAAALDWVAVDSFIEAYFAQQWSLEGAIHSALRGISLLPSLAFGVETALLDLVAQRKEVPAYKLLGGDGAYFPLPLNQTIAGSSPGTWPARALEWKKKGFSTLKLKIGEYDLDEELHALQSVRRAVGPAVNLRLDANRRLPPQVAGDWLLRAKAMAQPEFVEEPTQPEKLHLCAEGGVPLALDESLHGLASDGNLEDILARTRAAVVVLKPMALGGAVRTRKLALQARALGAKVVVTHMWDGVVGLRAAMEVALSLAPRLACGLAPHEGIRAEETSWLPRLDGALLRPTEDVSFGKRGAP